MYIDTYIWKHKYLYYLYNIISYVSAGILPTPTGDY